jgi:single-strand DNA-binding protein
MGSLNRVQLIGNLGRDPELRYTAEGTPVCNFSIATTEQWTSKAGEKQERTEWHRISMWGKLGEIAGQYLKKGRQVYVEGSIRSHEYLDKEGVKKTAHEIRGDRMVMLNSGERQDGTTATKPAQTASRPAPAAAKPQAATEPDYGAEFSDEDIPF